MRASFKSIIIRLGLSAGLMVSAAACSPFSETQRPDHRRAHSQPANSLYHGYAQSAQRQRNIYAPQNFYNTRQYLGHAANPQTAYLYPQSAISRASAGAVNHRSRKYAQVQPRQDIPALRRRAASPQPYPQQTYVDSYPPIPSHAPQNFMAQPAPTPEPTMQSYPPRLPQALRQTSFNQSLRSAYLQSPKLAIEQLKIQEAEEGLEQAKAQSRLKFDLKGTLGASQSETTYSIINRTDSEFNIQRSAEVGLSLPLYEGGSLKSKQRSAGVGIKAANANLLAVESDLIQDTALTYLNISRDRELVEIYRQNVELLEKQQRTAEILLRNGENTVSDKALIDTRLATILVDLEQAEADLRHNESAYRKLVKQAPPRTMIVPKFRLPQSYQEVRMISQSFNPEIRAARIASEASVHDIAIAKSASRPSLALKGVLRGAEGQSNTISRDTAAELLLNFSMPLSSGGENKSKVRQALLAQSRHIIEIHDKMDDLSVQTEQLWSTLQATRRKQALYDAQIASARAAYDAISQQKDVGLATILDVLSVEQTLLDSQINRVQSQSAKDVAAVQLLALMGNFQSINAGLLHK